MAAIRFFSADWAAAARTAINEGPDPATVERKLEGFWNWIERAKANVNCTLGLAVRDLPDGGPDAIVLELERGACTGVSLTTRAQAEPRCTYLLAGDCAAWREVMDGYDMGRSIMYRKLLLEQGELLVPSTTGPKPSPACNASPPPSPSPRHAVAELWTNRIYSLHAVHHHFPPPLLGQIDAVAQRQGVSRNRFVMRACQDAIAKDAGEWPEHFFHLDLDPGELAVLREAGHEMERSIRAARHSRGAPLL